MANKIATTSFETIEGIAKAANRGMADVAGDVAQAVSGGVDESLQGQVLPSSQKSQIKDQDAQHAAQVRQNIAQINQQIVEARRKRENKVIQTERKTIQENQVKKFEAKKKESVLMKLIKSYKGTKEGLPKASG